MRAVLHSLGASVLALSLAAACGGSRASSSATVTSAEAPTNLPVGLPLTVRITDGISTAATTDGTRFTAVLVKPVIGRDGKEILPEGSIIYGAVVESQKGGVIRQPRLTLTLNEVQFSKGTVRLATDVAGAESDRNGTIRALGSVVGTPVLLDDGKTLRIQPGTQLEFHLTEAARIE